MSGCVFSNSAITCCSRSFSSGLDDQPDRVTVVALAVLVPAWALATTSAMAAIETRKAVNLRMVSSSWHRFQSVRREA